MDIKDLHSWDVTTAEARSLQESIRHRVRITPLRRRPEVIAGVDVACPRSAPLAVSGVVVMQVPDWRVIERRFAILPLSFPYVPGLLSFREGQAVLEALRQVVNEPDAVIFDGQGLCHPRRFGLACHIGVLIDRPSVGCAKSLLVGTHAEPGVKAGSRRQILHRGEIVGTALRTRAGVRPVYVSVGHLVDLAGAVRIVRAAGGRYRIPEPIRHAHSWVTELSRRRVWEEGAPSC